MKLYDCFCEKFTLWAHIAHTITYHLSNKIPLKQHLNNGLHISFKIA